jgi:hypothetical protein
MEASSTYKVDTQREDSMGVGNEYAMNGEWVGA